jgi:hypothetical protein
MRRASWPVLLLLGCGHYTYVKPGATFEHRERDEAECKGPPLPTATATTPGTLGDSVWDLVGDFAADAFVERCMKEKGWRLRKVGTEVPHVAPDAR